MTESDNGRMSSFVSRPASCIIAPISLPFWILNHTKIATIYDRTAMSVYIYASSVKSVGRFWFWKLAKCMVESNFGGFKGSETIRFSHSDFYFIIQALYNAA